MFSTLRQVGRRIEAGKGLEVANEMGLIVIPTGQGDLRPFDTLPITAAVDQLYNFLKPPHPAEKFRRQPDLLAEKLDEAPLAQADLSGHIRNSLRVRHALKMAQRKGDGWMMLDRLARPRQQSLFEHVELRVEGFGFEQSLTQFARRRCAPQIFQR